jgi:hypothetical protein
MADQVSTPYRQLSVSVADGVVVDLRPHLNKLLNYQDIADDLSDDEERRLVMFVKAAFRMSFDRISKRYDEWKMADRAHDLWVPANATRFREKAVVADTRAISDTVVTYLMAALAGRNPMFMLEGLNRKSEKASAIMERVLHLQMRQTGAEARIAQLLLDSVRYGFAPTKINWDNRTNSNQMVGFDPRRCYPDPRVTWGDWAAMQFIGFTSFGSYDQFAQTGLYPKMKKYPGLRILNDAIPSGWENHLWLREEMQWLNVNPMQPTVTQSDHRYFKLGNAHVMDELWVRLNGFEIGVPQIDEIWLVVTCLDERVIARLQLNPYGQQFPVVIGGLFNDFNRTYGQSLYDLLLPLHNIATWLMRSRIDNVQAALNNLIFADPTQISIPDLIDRNPWGVVRALPGGNPKEAVYIAEVPDVTKGHWNDIAALADMKQRVSAASDAQQGVPTTDVRTATEIQRLTQLGSQRLGVLSRIMSALTMRPAVNMMVANIQDALVMNGSVRIDKRNTPAMLLDQVDAGYLDFNVADLQGKIDYMVVDGTLPLEPSRNSSTWLNMLQILQNTGLIMEYKAGRIAEEAIKAMGVPDIEQFRITPEEAAQGPTPSQQMALMEKARGASVMPSDDLNREVERGNLIPAMGQGGGGGQ